MPHHGEYEHVKEWLQDHDADVVDETPPAQNTWYEVFDAEDVRLIWCCVLQNNDETAAKDIEVRWTIDGNVYLGTASVANNTFNWAYRNQYASSGGTTGLNLGAAEFNASKYTDKRGLTFKVEVRITSLPGTNQRLRAWCVRETLEVT